MKNPLYVARQALKSYQTVDDKPAFFKNCPVYHIGTSSPSQLEGLSHVALTQEQLTPRDEVVHQKGALLDAVMASGDAFFVSSRAPSLSEQEWKEYQMRRSLDQGHAFGITNGDQYWVYFN